MMRQKTQRNFFRLPGASILPLDTVSTLSHVRKNDVVVLLAVVEGITAVVGLIGADAVDNGPASIMFELEGFPAEGIDEEILVRQLQLLQARHAFLLLLLVQLNGDKQLGELDTRFRLGCGFEGGVHPGEE